MKLSELQIGRTATIFAVGGSGALRQHFLDMGLIQGTEVTVVKYAPMGDPIELRIHGYELTIRLEDAENIEISEPHEAREHGELSGKQAENGKASKVREGWKIPRKRRSFIRDTARAESSTTGRRKSRFRTVRF